MCSLKVGIAGAGIMGRLLAFQLVNSGCQVTLFDKDAIEQGAAAAYTAAGMLTPYSEVESAELLIYRMGMASLALWPKLIEQLNADVGFYQKGSLIVAHGSDQSDLKRFNQQLTYKLDANQLVTSDLRPRVIDRSELTALEPEIASKFSEATYLPDEAWLCPKCLMQALAESLLANGVSWYAHTCVERVDSHLIVANKQKYEFDWVVDCRGLGAKPDWKSLRGVRGEVIALQAHEVKITRLLRLMHPRYRLYIVPRMKEDIYVIGATQIESNDSGPITVRSSLELLSAVYSLHSGFAEARVLETRANCRPALVDNLPRVEAKSGFIRVNGLYRHGFLLAPVLVDEVSRFIAAPRTSHVQTGFKPSYQNLFHQI